MNGPVFSAAFGVCLYGILNVILGQSVMPRYQVPAVLLALNAQVLPLVTAYYVYARFGVVGKPVVYWVTFVGLLVLAYVLLHEVFKRLGGADSPAPLPLGHMFVVVVVCCLLFMGGDNFYLDALKKAPVSFSVALLFLLMPLIVAIGDYVLEQVAPTKWHYIALAAAVVMLLAVVQINKAKIEKEAAAAAKISDGVTQVVSAPHVK